MGLTLSLTERSGRAFRLVAGESGGRGGEDPRRRDRLHRADEASPPPVAPFCSIPSARLASSLAKCDPFLVPVRGN